MRESFCDISPCPCMAQAGTVAHGSKQRAVCGGWWSPSAVGHHAVLHSNIQCPQFPLPLPTQTEGLSRMALGSCTGRCGIAGALHESMPISEDSAEKTTKNPIQPKPTQATPPTLALADPTKQGVGKAELVCSNNYLYISTYLMVFR